MFSFSENIVDFNLYSTVYKHSKCGT